MQHSPHLPPPACNVAIHYKMRSLSRVVLVVFLAFLTGITATLVTYAWILPYVSPLNSYTQIQNAGKRNQPQALDAVMVQQARQRMMRIYNTQKKVGGAYYTNEGYISDALVLSSDGWAVVYAKGVSLPDTLFWEGVDHQGITHRVTQVVKSEDAWYVRFAGEGFRIMPFANWENILEETPLWQLRKDLWRQGVIGEVSSLESGAHIYPVEIVTGKTILPNEEKKSILLNTDGEFVGFADLGKIRLPSWRIDYEIGLILREGKITHRSFPWKGFFVSSVENERGIQGVSGFFVESTQGKTATTTVMRGDVITRIDTFMVDEETLARRVLSAPDNVLVRVLRDGEELTVVAQKIDVTF